MNTNSFHFNNFHYMKRFAVTISVVATLAASCAGIEPPSPSSVADLPVPHQLRVYPAVSAPVIDGDLSDSCWESAATIPTLFPARGVTGASLQSTIVKAVWTNDFLYVAFDCVDAEVWSSGQLKHDDNIYTEDVVEIFIDGKGDQRQYIEIQIAPDGTNLDLMYVFSHSGEMEHTADGRVVDAISRRDRWGFREWEMVGLKTAARKTERGWTAEAALPAAQIVRRLGVKEFASGMELRVQFMRYDHVPVVESDDSSKRRIIQQNWVPVVHGNPHNSPALFGTLKLLSIAE